MLGRQHLHRVVHLEQVARVGVVDAMQRARSVMEAASHDVGIQRPCGPRCDGVMQEHHAHACIEQCLEPGHELGGGRHDGQRWFGSGELHARHVVEHDGIHIAEVLWVQAHLRVGVLDVFVGDLLVGVEQGQERFAFERVPFGDQQNPGGAHDAGVLTMPGWWCAWPPSRPTRTAVTAAANATTLLRPS